ncbi:MAG: hypothetical protein MUF49_10120 [Oculatellaceae cyanobacterium Prado106]|jgi:predicted dinucleotide-binding enzyme|nr:hypothetical protein [Oculatellaceae cyanobacterium Prado106]
MFSDLLLESVELKYPKLAQEHPATDDWEKRLCRNSSRGYEAVNAGNLKVARSLKTLATAWVQFAVASGLFPNLGLKALRR